MGIISDLIPDIDSILGVRDDLGAQKALVYLVTRTWDGDEIGVGTATEERTQMLPTPRVVRLNNDFKMRAGGQVDSADILLKMVSKESFPTKADVNCIVSTKGVEKFYEVDGELFRVISIEPKHVTWNVTLRKMTDQRYRGETP